MTSVQWQAYRRIPRPRSEGGDLVVECGQPFPASDKQYASLIGRHLVGRQFDSVRSLASLREDAMPDP